MPREKDMVEVTDEVGPDEAIVERRIVPTHRRRFSVLALVVVLAFVLTCGVVFFGRPFGITGSSQPPVTISVPAARPPQPTTP
jgi:hypothetical protein